MPFTICNSAGRRGRFRQSGRPVEGVSPRHLRHPRLIRWRTGRTASFPSAGRRPEIRSPCPALPPTVIRMFIAPGLQLPAGFPLPVAPACDTRI